MTVKIGIADDNIEFCQTLADFFDALPELEVVATFHNGLEVINLLPKFALDVLLLDVIMPQVDGLGVLQWLKQNQQYRNLKVIILSAFGHEDIARNAADLGACYYILKPFDLLILSKRIIEIAQAPNSCPIYHEKSASNNFKDEISKLFLDLKIPPHYKGYSYLNDAILLTATNPALINEMTKKLYPLIAERHQTNQHRVERAMRFAIETAWSKGNIIVLHEIFGYCVDDKKGKPTNASFIAKISDKLRLEKKLQVV